jgi:hypothetical protein
LNCYECSKSGVDKPAVAICRSCSAGLYLEHLRETSAYLATGAIRPSCAHDTWSQPMNAATRAAGRG